VCSKLWFNVIEITALHLYIYEQKPSKPLFSCSFIDADVIKKFFSQVTGSHVMRKTSNAGTTILFLQHGEHRVTPFKVSTTP